MPKWLVTRTLVDSQVFEADTAEEADAISCEVDDSWALVDAYRTVEPVKEED